MERFSIYAQPINYPTVPRGSERIRLTPTPLHSDTDIDHLVSGLSQTWHKLGLPFVLNPQAMPAMDYGRLIEGVAFVR
jgi:hypothetical protein